MTLSQQESQKVLDCDLMTSFDYTSGDINDRLKRVSEVVDEFPSYKKELAVLKEAQPLVIPLSKIIIKLGATWIPIKYYEQFCLEVFEVDIKLFYSNYTNLWEIRGGESHPKEFANWEWGWKYDINDDTRNIKEGFYTDRSYPTSFPAVGKKMSDGLFTLALKQKAPEIKIKKTANSDPEVDSYFTKLAIAKQNQLKRKFESWCRENDDRAEELESIYNAMINVTVLPDWTGKGVYLRENLKTLDMSEEWISKLRNYQLDAIWRFALTGGINALEVGLGKTAVACATVLLRKHYKTCTKAMAIVKKSTLDQFYKDFREMFPKAKVLCARSQDLSDGNRQKFLAKVAFYNWDCVIITHESFKQIPLRHDTEKDYITEELRKIQKEISALHMEGESRITRGKRLGNAILKKLEAKKADIEIRLEELRSIRDVGIAWENLGIDFLIADEIQEYKNKPLQSALGSSIKGIKTGESKRAEDFDLKVYWLRKNHGKDALMGMTGTPEPTNSLVGIYVFQTLFQPEELTKRGIYTLDSWITNFGEIKSKPEPKMHGEWAMTDRLSDFINVGELVQMWYKSVHFKRYESIKEDFLGSDQRPKAVYKTEVSLMNDFQREGMLDVAERYKLLREGRPNKYAKRDPAGYLIKAGTVVESDENDDYGDTNKDKYDLLLHPVTKSPITSTTEANRLNLKFQYTTDNYLALFILSRHLMIAPQLVDPTIEIGRDSKILGLANKVLEVHENTANRKLTQVIFLEIGTPKGSAKFGIYEWLAKYWVDHGIPSKEIAFIQNYPPKKRASLYSKFNNGEIRILIATTKAAGIGVNIQERLCAVHHADFPYRPDELEQREGRAIRQGNINKEVEIYRYITEGSHGKHGADTVSLQILENKQKSRDRFFSGDPNLRRLSEGDETAQLYMILKAESTGDERIIRYTEVEVELDEKQSELALIQSELARINGKKADSITNSERILKGLSKEAEDYQVDISTVTSFQELDVDPDSYLSYLFNDGTLIVGYTECVRKKIFLDKPEWLKQLRSLYEHKSFRLLPKRDAERDIVRRIKAEVSDTDEAAKNGRIGVFDIGKYKGMRVVVQNLGNDNNKYLRHQYRLFLIGQERWGMVYRRTNLLVLEQLEKGIKLITNSLDRNNKAVKLEEGKIAKLLKSKADLEARLIEAEDLVASLDKEKLELRNVLEIKED